MTLAILCSGQGNQHPDMFALTAEEPAAADVFAAATAALDGCDPRDLVRDGDADIHGNRVGQVLCCTQALAACAALRDSWGERLIIAGYSVGELASWACAGLVEPADLLSLAGERAAAMDAAGGPHDGLAHVRGLSRAAVDDLCRAHDAVVAIVNPGDAFVVGGERSNLQEFCETALAYGATNAGQLKVEVASHTPRLAAAVAPFRAALGRITATRIDPRLRLMSGIDAAQVRSIALGLDKLAQQLAHPIDWAGCLEACTEAGMTAALELGPGHGLASMVTNAYPGANARSLDDFRSLGGVRAWLREALNG